MVQYIPSSTLANWLDFSTETIQLWANEGKLDKHLINGTIHHSDASITALLVRVNRGMSRPPTFEDLRTQKIRLLNSAETAKILGLTTLSLQNKLQRGRMAGLRFNGG